MNNWKFNWKKSQHPEKRHKNLTLDDKELETSEKVVKKVINYWKTWQTFKKKWQKVTN